MVKNWAQQIISMICITHWNTRQTSSLLGLSASLFLTKQCSSWSIYEISELEVQVSGIKWLLKFWVKSVWENKLQIVDEMSALLLCKCLQNTCCEGVSHIACSCLFLFQKGFENNPVWDQARAVSGGTWSYWSSFQLHFPGENKQHHQRDFNLQKNTAGKEFTVYSLLSLRCRTLAFFQ